MPTSGTIDQLLIEIKGTSNSVSNAIDKLTTSLQGLYKAIDIDTLQKFNVALENIGTSAGNAVKSLKKVADTSSGSVSNGFKKLGNIVSSAAGFLLGGIDANYLSGVFKNATNAATGYFETVNYFNIAMGQYSEQAYDYAQKVSDVLGIDEDQWMNNQATFMSLATTFGNTSDNAYLMSQNLTQLVYDLSSLKNVNADVSMQKLRSAFAGEIEPLRDWGVDLSKANLQLVALENNITKPFDKMTQAEKSQLRYVTIMNQLEYAMGDLSNTLTQPANQLRVLEANITKAARALGNIFIPALNAILPLLISFVRVIRMVFEQIAALFGFEYPEVTNWNRYSDGINGVSDSLDDATGKAKKLKKQLAGFDEINNLTTNQGSGSGSDSSGVFGNLNLPTYESLGKSFISQELEDKITNITEKIKGFLPIIMGITAAVIALKIALDLPKLIASITALFALLAANPGALAIAVIAGIVVGLVTLYKTNDEARAKIDSAIKAVGAVIQWIWNTILLPVGKFLVGTFIATIWAVQITISTVAGLIKGTIYAIYSFINLTWNMVSGILDGIIKFISGVFTGDWEKAWEGVSDIFGSIWNGIKEMFKIPINWIIDGINGFLRGLNRIQIPDWVPLVGGKGFSFGMIPRLATGGIVSSPTTALIGENGAEAIVPLEKNTEWINRVAAQINGGNNSEIVVMLERVIDAINDKDLDVNIGDRDIYNANLRETNKQNRLLGRAY